MGKVDSDYLVVGSGLAGMIAALHLAPHGSVTLVTKCALVQSNSDWAQGGISCVMDPEDSLEAHVQDTLATGGGVSNEAAVRAIIGQSREAIHELEQLGVGFERRKDGSGYDLGQEAGHSARRILHAGDITGHAVIQALVAQVKAQPAIRTAGPPPGFEAFYEVQRTLVDFYYGGEFLLSAPASYDLDHIEIAHPPYQTTHAVTDTR